MPPGRNAAWAGRKYNVMPTIIMASEGSSPEVLPIRVTSPKPVVESAAKVERVHEVRDLLVRPVLGDVDGRGGGEDEDGEVERGADHLLVAADPSGTAS